MSTSSGSQAKYDSINWGDRHCPVCGKYFYQYSIYWAWKTGTKIFCSYKCARVYDKQHSKDMRNYKGKPILVDGVLYKTMTDAANDINTSCERIKYTLDIKKDHLLQGHKIEYLEVK